MAAPSVAGDQASGIPVGRSIYGMTEADIRNTLVKIAQYIREGARTPSIRKIADSAVTRVYPRGEKTSNRQVAQALLDFVREHVRYRPDPNMVEMVQSAKVTLCADDAPICIPVGDCDDLVSATGALFGSMGIDVRVLVQDYGAGHAEQHVLILFQDDDGSWLTADPSSKTKPIGLKDTAVNEYTVDPLNPQEINMPSAPQAEFITVGRPKTLGSGKKPCCSACAEGKPCTGCGSKVHPCPCETGQMVGAGKANGVAPRVGARPTLGAPTATGLVTSTGVGMVLGGTIGTLAGYRLAKNGKAGVGWQLLAAGLGAVLGMNLGTVAGAAVGTAMGGPAA